MEKLFEIGLSDAIEQDRELSEFDASSLKQEYLVGYIIGRAQRDSVRAAYAPGFDIDIERLSKKYGVDQKIVEQHIEEDSDSE